METFLLSRNKIPFGEAVSTGAKNAAEIPSKARVPTQYKHEYNKNRLQRISNIKFYTGKF